jgi:hypothetical protein
MKKKKGRKDWHQNENEAEEMRRETGNQVVLDAFHRLGYYKVT